QVNGKGGLRGEGEDATPYQRTQGALLTSTEVLNRALDSTKREVADLRQGRSRDELLSWLKTDLVLDYTRGPELIAVTLTGDREEKLAPVLNEIADAFDRVATERETARIRARIDQLEKARRDAEKGLKDARAELD